MEADRSKLPAVAGKQLAEWYRVGGHVLQFYATDDEIVEWLREMLPTTFAPYRIVGKRWQEGRRQPFHYALDEITELLTLDRAASFWIRSDVLSPGLTGEDERVLSFNGLINVQPGRKRNGRVGDASVGIVDRIRHESTGRERRQPEYLRIFERLRRSMRKRLVVTTLYTLPDGSQSDHFLMTERAADAHSRGDVTFAAEPVGLRS